MLNDNELDKEKCTCVGCDYRMQQIAKAEIEIGKSLDRIAFLQELQSTLWEHLKAHNPDEREAA